MDINKEIEKVLSNYPNLKYDKTNNALFGKIYISKNDYYELRIEINSYPNFFPSVYELDDRIPKKMDRHIYTNTGACCFTTRAKAQILLKTKIKSLYLFVSEILVKYLENNSYFEINKKYFDEEYSHGILGDVEGYKDILGIVDEVIIARLMLQRLKNEKLTIRDFCYCNSGFSLKKCNNGMHDRNYRDFRKIDKELLHYDLQNVIKVIEVIQKK